MGALIHCIELLLDVKRCFDQVDRSQWEKIADRLGFPVLAAG